MEPLVYWMVGVPLHRLPEIIAMSPAAANDSLTHMVIRPERPDDHPQIRQLLCAAFPSCGEADLVEALRRAGRLCISLIATDGEALLGQIAFSPVTVDGREAPGLGLGPLAVAPQHQRRGVGSALVHEGLKACRRLQTGFVVVLGDPVYYRRFGFETASRRGLANEYSVDDPFRVLELRPGALESCSGLVQYAVEFATLGGDLHD